MTYSRKSVLHTVIPFSLFLLFSVPQALAGTWIYPLPNTDSIYNRTDTLNATWATTFSEPYMVLWCQATDASTSTADFNVSVSSAGSRAIDLSEYGKQTSGCHLEVADVESGVPSLSSPSFHINELESNPPTTWHLSDASVTSSAPATSFTSALSIQSISPISSSTFAGSTNSSNIETPTAQAATSSSSSSRKTSDSSGLSTGTIVGITLGSVIVMITILVTLWYIWRSHRESDAFQLEDLAGVKAAELESSRAVSDIDSVHARNERFRYPRGVGEDPSPLRRELGGRPYWGRPF